MNSANSPFIQLESLIFNQEQVSRGGFIYQLQVLVPASGNEMKIIKIPLSTLSKLCKKQFLCLVILGNIYMTMRIWVLKHVGFIDVT